MYRCKNFKIEELVPQTKFEAYKDNQNILWLVFDKNILYIADKLRNDYGPMICNDWIWGGKNHYRGFRPQSCDIGADLSQHKFGRGLDLIPKYVHPDEIREAILNREKKYMEKISAIEMNISWLHIDVRNNKGKIVKFWPS